MDRNEIYVDGLLDEKPRLENGAEDFDERSGDQAERCRNF